MTWDGGKHNQLWGPEPEMGARGQVHPRRGQSSHAPRYKEPSLAAADTDQAAHRPQEMKARERFSRAKSLQGV